MVVQSGSTRSLADSPVTYRTTTSRGGHVENEDDWYERAKALATEMEEKHPLPDSYLAAIKRHDSFDLFARPGTPSRARELTETPPRLLSPLNRPHSSPAWMDPKPSISVITMSMPPPSHERLRPLKGSMSMGQLTLDQPVANGDGGNRQPPKTATTSSASAPSLHHGRHDHSVATATGPRSTKQLLLRGMAQVRVRVTVRVGVGVRVRVKVSVGVRVRVRASVSVSMGYM